MKSIIKELVETRGIPRNGQFKPWAWKPLLDTTGIEKVKRLKSIIRSIRHDDQLKGFLSKVSKKENLPLALYIMNEDDRWMRLQGALIIKRLADSREKIDVPITQLAEALRDPDAEVAHVVLLALEYAAKKGADISVAIPNVAEMLYEKDMKTVRTATFVLANAAEHGLDISPAFLDMVKTVARCATDKHFHEVGPNVFLATSQWLHKAPAQERRAAAKEMFDFMQSEWMRDQAEENKPGYVETAWLLVRFYAVLKHRENGGKQ